ncbi:MAG TPA: hypothetical protein VM222_06005 [Planctomycetota bacterium]|nr:hypothetical protein [Planctomycetota bacterium]
MKQPIANALIAISLVSLVFVVGGFVAIVLVFFQDNRISFTMDAVHVISMSVGELYRKGPAPSQEQIDDRIRDLVNASVINAGLDAQQRPVDPYGTPFRVRHALEGRLHRVTATSAGPDRQFDTPDDIRRDAAWETQTPEKR